MVKEQSTVMVSAADWDRLHAQLLDDALANPKKYERAGERLDGNPISIGPRVAPPDEWVNNYVDGANANADKWLKHASNPSKNPLVEASKKAEKWKNSIQDAIAKNRFKRGVDSANADLMIDTIIAVGTAGYMNGINARKPKMQAKIAKLQPLVAAHTQAMDLLPTDNLAQRKDKVLKNIDGMIAIGDKLRGG